MRAKGRWLPFMSHLVRIRVVPGRDATKKRERRQAIERPRRATATSEGESKRGSAADERLASADHRSGDEARDAADRSGEKHGPAASAREKVESSDDAAEKDHRDDRRDPRRANAQRERRKVDHRRADDRRNEPGADRARKARRAARGRFLRA